MMTLRLCARNVLRNRRRSLMTAGTLVVGAVASLLLGALMNFILLDFQTSTVRRAGHLTVFTQGYFEFGGGNPGEYGIPRYRELIALLETDPELRPMLAVVTPYQMVYGVAGNYRANLSKTFFGRGVVAADQARLRRWNDYRVDDGPPPQAPLQGPDSGFVGLGMARILGLCEPLRLPRCTPRPAAPGGAVLASGGDSLPPGVLDAVAEQQRQRAQEAGAEAGARIELLAATVGGAPNVVSLRVDRTDAQGIKDLDDSYVQMQLPLAQGLVYGRDEPRVTGITLQLHHSADMPRAAQRLGALFAAHGLQLEVRDFQQLTPLYRQATAFFRFLFGFVTVIICVIVLFTVVNTMSMCVMERVAEIGTLRALGVQRPALALQFLGEGGLLGLAGASLGVLLAAAIVAAVNAGGMTWTPPTAAGPVPLRLYLWGDPTLPAAVWAALVAVAALASVWPARRAARLQVVEALRHA